METVEYAFDVTFAQEKQTTKFFYDLSLSELIVINA
jgi:hypothetical protein